MERGEREFNAVESAIDNKLEEFEEALSASKKQFFDSVSNFINELEYKDGKLVRSVKNVKTAVKVKNSIDELFRTGIIKDQATSFKPFFKEIQSLLDEYFVKFFDKPPLEFERDLINYYSTEISRNLISGGVSERFKTGVTEIVLTGIKSGLSRADLTTQLKESIVDSDKLFRHAGQVVEDTMNQFAREYVELVSADLGLKHYFYKGTLVKDSRCFCRQRVGRYFTQKQVDSWVSLSWGGKIKDTNKGNIKRNLGGWRCRHFLIPVSNEQYNRKTSLHGVNGKVNCNLK